ncbi:hypothetical protein ABPG74_021726 [Tetrahymena malaccensis]
MQYFFMQQMHFNTKKISIQLFLILFYYKIAFSRNQTIQQKQEMFIRKYLKNLAFGRYNFSTQAQKQGGNLYLWQGSTFTSTSDLKPVLVKVCDENGKQLDNKIQKVVLGQNVSALITTEGHLYTFGEGKFGALGHNDGKDYKEPKHLEFFAKKGLRVVDVVCGNSYMMALTHDGDVWTWGWGGKGRNIIMQQFFSFAGALGHGDQKHHYSPQPVQALRKLPQVKSISGGLYFALAMNVDNELYYWGRGSHGAFGDGYSKDLLLPRRHNYFEVLQKTEKTTIKSLKSCNYYTVAHLSDGKLVGWGSNDYGQMGINNEIGVEMHETSPYPSLVHSETFNSPIQDFQIAEDVVVIRLQNGEVHYSGMKLAYLPKKFELPTEAGKIKTFGAAFRSFAVVDEFNNIFMKNKFLKTDKENIKTGVYSADNSLFDKGNILSIGGTYRTHYAVVQH